MTTNAPPQLHLRRTTPILCLPHLMGGSKCTFLLRPLDLLRCLRPTTPIPRPRVFNSRTSTHSTTLHYTTLNYGPQPRGQLLKTSSQSVPPLLLLLLYLEFESAPITPAGASAVVFALAAASSLVHALASRSPRLDVPPAARQRNATQCNETAAEKRREAKERATRRVLLLLLRPPQRAQNAERG